MSENISLQKIMIKEIELIQDIIKRMAFNSFMIKGWAITLVVVSLLIKSADKQQAWIAFIPLLVFWYLDAYFLWQERMYRKLYEWVIDHRLETDEKPFSLDAYRFRETVQSKFRIMFSETLLWFYGAIAVLILAYGLFIIN